MVFPKTFHLSQARVSEVILLNSLHIRFHPVMCPLHQQRPMQSQIFLLRAARLCVFLALMLQPWLSIQAPRLSPQ